MQINEIFYSIDGEGIRTGKLVTFIRTQFCNCKCSYCDTAYSLEAYDPDGNKLYKDMTVDEVIEEVQKYPTKCITFTGGEPLIQPDAPELITKLVDMGYEVNVETNGAVDLVEFEKQLLPHVVDSDNFFYTMDYKCPSSNMEPKMVKDNIPHLQQKDVLKFVVGTIEDLNTMKNIVQTYNPNCEIFISPVFGDMDGETMVEYIKQNNLLNVRVQVQLHKIFWDVNMRGV